jgi:PAS domain S-box-containing protein
METMNFFAADVDRLVKPRGVEAALSGTAEDPVSGLHRVLLDGLTGAAALLSLDGLILDCNRTVLEAAGGERDKIAGRPLWDALPLSPGSPAQPELRDALVRAAQRPVQLEVDLELPLRQDPRDGGPGATRFEFHLRPVAGKDGRAAFLVAEGREIGAESGREQEAARRLEAAERERSRLQDLLAHTPVAIGLLTGPEHRWSFINDEFVRMTGRMSPADFLDKAFSESLPEMQTQPFQALLDQVYRTGKPSFGREIKAQLNRTASGQRRDGYFDYLYHPTRNAEGAIDGIYVYAIEVTDRVEARQAIEEHSERLRLAQSAGQIGVWEWDPVQEKNDLSPELHRMFGTEPDDPDRTRKWLARIYPADRAQVELLMWEGHRLGSMEFEYRYLHPDRGLRWLYCKGMRRPGETRMYGIVQDVTVRKAAEQDSQRLAAIITSSDDAIVSKDLNGLVTSWNAGAERIFGFTPEEMIGKSITKIIPPELYDDETRILSTIARGERIEHFETVRLKKNGEPVNVSLTISPVRDASGKIIGAAKIARDVTQQKRAERALRTSERLASVGRLAATVAHEINNPLEAVTNLIFLAQSANSLEAVHKYLDMSQEELKRISHLTRQTLGFYRETKGATKMRLGEQVESLLSVFAPRMRNKSIRLFKEINDDVEICAVPGEIRQVIANLISNSIDAINSGGQLRVRVSHSIQTKDTIRPGVRLSVADTGHGIPSEIRPQLFEPFFTTKRDVGTGLGLWICRSIVEAHQGIIQVRSSTVSGRSGTVFSIFLPVDCAERCTPGNLAPSQRNSDVREIMRGAA